MKLRGMKILSRKNENSLIDSTWESMICKNVAVSFPKTFQITGLNTPITIVKQV